MCVILWSKKSFLSLELRRNARDGTWGLALYHWSILHYKTKNPEAEKLACWGKIIYLKTGWRLHAGIMDCQDVLGASPCPNSSPPTEPRHLVLKLITTQCFCLTIFHIFLQFKKHETEEMAQELRARSVPTEDPSLVPSYQARASVYIYNDFKNES